MIIRQFVFLCLLSFPTCLTGTAQDMSNIQEVLSGFSKETTPLNESDGYAYGSYFNAMLSNGVSWETGDILITVTSSLDSTGREVTDSEKMLIVGITRHRFRFDFPNNRFLYARESEPPSVVIPVRQPEANTKEPERVIGAFVRCDGETRFRDFPQKTQEVHSNADISRLFLHYGLPEFRTLGLCKFGANLSPRNFNVLVARLSSGEDIERVKKVDHDKIEIVHRAERLGSDSEAVIYTTMIDTERLVPLKRTYEVEITKEDGSRALHPNGTESFQWKEIDGVMVPVSILKEGTTASNQNGKLVVFESRVEVNLSWVSLNTPFEAEDFNSAVLEEFDSVVRFLERKPASDD